jgi:hypothetical protein
MSAVRNGKAATNGHTNRIADLESAEQSVTITAPNMQVASFRIRGDAPYVQLMFGAKARSTIAGAQKAGSAGGNRKKREPKDFDALYQEAQHISKEGWNGIPASALRQALVNACTLVKFFKTVAKKSIFVLADGYDRDEGSPLIRIHDAEPRQVEHMVRNATGVCDVRVRAMFDLGWSAIVRVRFDADQMTLSDVANLLTRAGMQVGIGEGRPDSKNSIGMGWGTFVVEGTA